MKPIPRAFLLLICASCVFMGNLFAQEAASTGSLEPKLITPINAIVPIDLQNKAIQDPRVVAKIQVAGTGRVEDLVVLEASHVGLVDRAESLIRRALFDPGEVGLEESVRFELILPFSYPAELGVSNKNVGDDIEIAIETVKAEDRSLGFHSMKELDAPVSIVERGAVYMPQDGAGNNISGNAVVEFHVTHEGKVRLPRILSSTDDEVALAAIATFSDMTFTPPTFEGRPAVTQVRMPFNADPPDPQ